MKRALKKFLRSVLAKCQGKAIDKIPETMIEQAQTISFDVFDTLVLRTVANPTDVFEVVESSYNKGDHGKTISSFKSERIKAESVARSKSEGKEITLDAIYQELGEVYDPATVDVLKTIEVNTELDVCAANPELLSFYQRMKGLGKRIVMVSDMYLPSEVIGNILARCGYGGYEKLYVSSEYGVMKRYGDLFELVKKDYSDGSILHIGDHPIADYSVAKKKGVMAFLYRRKV